MENDVIELADFAFKNVEGRLKELISDFKRDKCFQSSWRHIEDSIGDGRKDQGHWTYRDISTKSVEIRNNMASDDPYGL